MRQLFPQMQVQVRADVGEPFAEWLKTRVPKDRRDRADWCRQHGLLRKTVSNYLRGKRTPSAALCHELADATGEHSVEVKRAAGYVSGDELDDYVRERIDSGDFDDFIRDRYEQHLETLEHALRLGA